MQSLVNFAPAPASNTRKGRDEERRGVSNLLYFQYGSGSEALIKNNKKALLVTSNSCIILSLISYTAKNSESFPRITENHEYIPLIIQ